MMATGVVGRRTGGVPGGQMGGVLGSIISNANAPVPHVATPQRRASIARCDLGSSAAEDQS